MKTVKPTILQVMLRLLENASTGISFLMKLQVVGKRSKSFFKSFWEGDRLTSTTHDLHTRVKVCDFIFITPKQSL